MNKIATLCAIALTAVTANAQILSLDSCRAMALRANKQLSVSRIQQQVAENVRKTARKKYLPHVDVVGSWQYMSRETSILNDDLKSALSTLGTTGVGTMNGMAQQLAVSLPAMVQAGMVNASSIPAIQDLMTIAGTMKPQLEAAGNALGEKIVDEFHTDTRNVFFASAMVTQPLYMGGAITAANRMAEIAEKMAMQKTDAAEQEVVYNIDQAYWMVVSLRHKQKLANDYLALVEKLNHDVHAMIKSGVATRADGLKVDVSVNEAEMTKTQVDNGVTLARMLLCQLIGLPLESDITLTDEGTETLADAVAMPQYDKAVAMEMRPELQLLGSAIELSQASVKLARAAHLPQLLLTGGYMLSNPNVFNGFQRKFGGMWNVGVSVRVPVLDWGESIYKVRAAKLSTSMAKLEREEAEEKINLQMTQCEYRLSEANKRLATARKNIQRAEENLRCANVGFQEGVMQTTDVMAAQTAWLQAQTQHVDAEIEVRMSEAGLKKAIGMR